jgi:hypothetical protein
MLNSSFLPRALALLSAAEKLPKLIYTCLAIASPLLARLPHEFHEMRRVFDELHALP